MSCCQNCDCCEGELLSGESSFSKVVKLIVIYVYYIMSEISTFIIPFATLLPFIVITIIIITIRAFIAKNLSAKE